MTMNQLEQQPEGVELMVDILVVKGPEKTRLISQSEKGFYWIIENLSIKHRPQTNISITIDTEGLPEMEELMKQYELDFETK